MTNHIDSIAWPDVPRQQSGAVGAVAAAGHLLDEAVRADEAVEHRVHVGEAVGGQRGGAGVARGGERPLELLRDVEHDHGPGVRPAAGRQRVRLAPDAALRQAAAQAVVARDRPLEVGAFARRPRHAGERQDHEAVAEEAEVVALARVELPLLAVRGEQVGDGAVLEEGVPQEEVGGGAGVPEQLRRGQRQQAPLGHARRVRHGPGPARLRPHELVVAHPFAADVVDAVEDAPALVVDGPTQPERQHGALEMVAVERGESRWVADVHDVLQGRSPRGRPRERHAVAHAIVRAAAGSVRPPPCARRRPAARRAAA
jgi:hypothetical protein